MNANARSLLALDSGIGDECGWALGHHFGIAEVLYANGERLPASWEFRPGAGSGQVDSEQWPDSEWAEMLDSGAVSADDLRHVGDVLARYCAVLRHAGRDY